MIDACSVFECNCGGIAMKRKIKTPVPHAELAFELECQCLTWVFPAMGQQHWAEAIVAYLAS